MGFFSVQNFPFPARVLVQKFVFAGGEFAQHKSWEGHCMKNEFFLFLEGGVVEGGLSVTTQLLLITLSLAL